MSIGTGTGGAGGCSPPPNKIIEGATSTYYSPNFFCALQLNVTLPTVRFLLAQKFSKIPQLLEVLPQTPL